MEDNGLTTGNQGRDCRFDDVFARDAARRAICVRITSWVSGVARKSGARWHGARLPSQDMRTVGALGESGVVAVSLLFRQNMLASPAAWTARLGNGREDAGQNLRSVFRIPVPYANAGLVGSTTRHVATFCLSARCEPPQLERLHVQMKLSKPGCAEIFDRHQWRSDHHHIDVGQLLQHT